MLRGVTFSPGRQGRSGRPVGLQLLQLLVLLLLVAVPPVAVSAVAAAEEEEEKSPSISNNNGEEPPVTLADACSLYLAPSSLAEQNLTYAGIDVGLGVYSFVDIPAGTVLSEDLMVPILDPYKTLPYKGQQRFKSWLRYIWPEETDAFYPSRYEGMYPKIPSYMFDRFGSEHGKLHSDFGLNDADGLKFYQYDPRRGRRVRFSAFAPGLASLANHAPAPLANIGRARPSSIDDESYVKIVALRHIPAGTELFLDYGPTYERRLQRRLREKQILDSRSFPANDDNTGNGDDGGDMIDYDHHVSQEDKWKIRDIDAHDRLIPNTLPTEEEKRRRRTQDKPADAVTDDGSNQNDPKKYSVRPRKEKNGEDEDGAVLSNEDRVEWLKNHGVCIDTMYTGPVQDDDEEEGAFSKTYIPEGSVVMPSPVLVLTRDDMKRHPFNPREPLLRKQLDLDTVIGNEPLLEYTYDHPDSELLLLPIGPVVNFLRHSDDTKKEPNVAIAWPDSTSPSSSPQSTVLFSQEETDEYKSKHPLDVIDHSGKLIINYVALRDIHPGEELIISPTLPDNFFPEAWMKASLEYKVAPPLGSSEGKLEPGQIDLMRWEHNGEPVAKNMYRVGLPEGFSSRVKNFAESKGFIQRYNELLDSSNLQSDQWQVFDKNGSEWFEHRFMNTEWNFNMVYMAAWNDRARKEMLAAQGQAGFDSTLGLIGEKFGLSNMTCFHSSFMGVSECDNSFIHADVYAVSEKGFNFIYPLVVVEGSPPELDVQTDDGNVQIGVNYEYDVAFALGDWVYHKTRTIEYSKATDIRIVVGTYCAQVDDTNRRMMRHIYDGEDPAPFMDQFQLNEVHWTPDGDVTKSLKSLFVDGL